MSTTTRNTIPEGSRNPSLQTAMTTPATGEVSRIEEAKAAAHDFSIVVGGPVYDFFLRIGLIRRGLPNVRPRIIAFVAIAWLPLLVLSIKDGLAIGDRVSIPLLLDFSTYGRLMLALPLLLLAEVVIDPAIRSAAEEFVEEGIVPEKDLPAFEEVLHWVQRWRDSAIPELVLIALAFFPMFLFQHEWKPGLVTSWHSTTQGLSTAGWWHVSISAPLFRFILLRWVFRYVVWALLLWQVSRLRLHLMPTHPDHAAGLQFLSRAQGRFGILSTALGCAFAGGIANSVIHEGVPLASFKLLIVTFLGLSVILGVCPLALLSPKLTQVRRIGLREYARLGNQYSEAFDRKWIHFAQPPTEPLLGTADIQSLVDMGGSYDLIHQMSIAPVTKRLAMQFAVLAGVPLIPVAVYATPTGAIVDAIMKMVA